MDIGLDLDVDRTADLRRAAHHGVERILCRWCREANEASGRAHNGMQFGARPGIKEGVLSKCDRCGVVHPSAARNLYHQPRLNCTQVA